MSTDIFGIHEHAMKLRAQRAGILAGNLANAETPGYKARDFDFHKALQSAQSASGNNAAALSRGDAAHLPGSGRVAGGQPLQYRLPQQPSLDGNTVDTQTERAAFMENALMYQASLQFVSGRVSGLLTAIRGE